PSRCRASLAAYRWAGTWNTPMGSRLPRPSRPGGPCEASTTRRRHQSGDRRVPWRSYYRTRALEHSDPTVPARPVQPQAAPPPSGAGLSGRSSERRYGTVAHGIRELGAAARVTPPRPAHAPEDADVPHLSFDPAGTKCPLVQQVGP